MHRLRYKESTACHLHVCLKEWHKRLCEDREDVQDVERSGHVCTSKPSENIQQIEQVVGNCQRLSARRQQKCSPLMKGHFIEFGIKKF